MFGRAAKFIWVVLALAALFALFSANAPRPTALAQGDPAAEGELTVEIEIVGVVVSLTREILVLDNGIILKVDANTLIAAGVAPGVRVRVIVEIVGDTLFARTVQLAAESTATPTPTPTFTPSPTPSMTSTPTPQITPTSTLNPTCGSGNVHPIGARLAEAFGVSYEEIMGWHCAGFGFGEIARAYALARETGKGDNPLTVEEIFAMRRSGEGWGNIVKATGVHPSKLAPGQNMKIKVKRGESEIEIGAANPVSVRGKGADDKGKPEGKGKPETRGGKPENPGGGRGKGN